VRIELIDERENKSDVLHTPAVLQAFVKYMNRNPHSHPRSRCSGSHPGRRGFRGSALQWNDSYQESMFCYTNNIPQKDGGTHLAGFAVR